MKLIGQACMVAVVIHFCVPLFRLGNFWVVNDASPLAYSIRNTISELTHLRTGARSSDWVEHELLRIGIPFEVFDGNLLLSMPTQHYRDQEGDACLRLQVAPGTTSGSVIITAPYLSRFFPDFNDSRIAKLSALQYGLTLLQLDYDPRDGEVRGRAQLPNFRPSAENSFHEVFVQLRDEVDAIATLLNLAEPHTIPYRGRRGQLRDGDAAVTAGVRI